MKNPSLAIATVVALYCSSVSADGLDKFGRCNTHDDPKKVIWACTKLLMDSIASESERCMLSFRRALGYIKKDSVCGLHGALSDLSKVISNKCPVIKEAHYKRAIVYQRLFRMDADYYDEKTLIAAQKDLQQYSQLEHSLDANQLVSSMLSQINHDLMRIQNPQFAYEDTGSKEDDFQHWLTSRINN